MTEWHFYKRAAAKRTYTVRWSGVLPTGVTLDSVTWTVPSPLTNLSESHTATDALVRIGGGVVGERYTVVCAVVFSDGQEDVQPFDLTIH